LLENKSILAGANTLDEWVQLVVSLTAEKNKMKVGL
jgi:hypothetical protein